MFQLWQLSTQDDEHCNMKNNLNDSTFLWSIEFVNLVEKIMWSPKYQAPKIGYSATACHKNSFLFLKRAIPGLFSVYFRLFNKHTLQFLQQIYVKNVHRTFEPTTFRLRVKSHNHWTRDPAHIKTVLPDLPPPPRASRQMFQIVKRATTTTTTTTIMTMRRRKLKQNFQGLISVRPTLPLGRRNRLSPTNERPTWVAFSRQIVT